MGPLSGRTVIEFDAKGPCPFACMLLSDMGADIIRIERAYLDKMKIDFRDTKYDIIRRGRRSIALDIRSKKGAEICLRLAEKADVLVEGFRPGVMERLGLGPDVCMSRNPKLVYGRMTGWGQSGPLAQSAGHDINYIALSGALHAMGSPGIPPTPPLNLLGDYSGALYLNQGILAALLEAERSGAGQVVDAAMAESSASMMTLYFGMRAAGMWSVERGVNMLDGGAHFYNTYETSDGKWIAVGSVEPQFYRSLLDTLGIEDAAFGVQMSPSEWPSLRGKLIDLFKTKTRDEWCVVFANSDACFTPVMSIDEVADHPHNRERQTFLESEGIMQPNVAPRFSKTPSSMKWPPPARGYHTQEILSELGFDDAEIQDLHREEIVLLAAPPHP